MEINGYFYEILVNGIAVGIPPSSVSFSLNDSVHSIYSNCKFSFNDYTGLIFEGKGIIEGMPLEVHLGYSEEDKITSPYIVKSYEIPSTTTPGNLNGVVNGELIHAFYNRQEIKSFAYKGPISTIVEEIVSDYPYKNTVIETTGNDDTWYRPLITQKDFITNILLGNAYSYNSGETPFFSFTDSNNVFHFESYNSMYSRNVVRSFSYKTVNRESIDPDLIYDIKPFSAGITQYYKGLKRLIHYQSQVDASVIELEDNIMDHPTPGDARFPYIGDTEIFTGKQFLNLYEEENPGKENLLGRALNALRKTFFTERFIITTALSIDVLAGMTIDLKTISFDDQGEVNSIYHSGKYLVERSQHTWNGEKQVGTSNFVIARKYVSIPDNYIVKENMYK